MMKQFTLSVFALLISIASFALTPITGPHTVCVGSTITLSDTTTGGIWSSSNPAVASIGSSTGVVSGLTVGAVTISYTLGAVVTYTVTVNPLPAAITGPGTVAVGSSITLTDATTGGTWSTGCPAIMTINPTSGLLTGVSAGMCFVTYTLPTGCYRTVYDTVTGTGGGGTLPITGPSTVCAGSSITLTDSTTGGTWSSSNATIASVGATTGLVLGGSPGVCTIYYTVGGSSVFKTITVNPVPAAITGPSTVAAGSSITLTETSTGGAWISGNTARATVNTAGVVTGVSAGTVSIYYQFSTGCGAFYAITVTGTVSVLPITGVFTACVGSTSTLLDSTSGGTWSSSNTAIATVGASTGIVSGVSAGVCTITYTVGTSIATHAFTVNPLPAPIGGPTTLSAGSTITMTDATTGGTWSCSPPTVATINATTGVLTGVGAGIVYIYYQLSTGCAVTRADTVTGAVVIAPISGTNHNCVGSTVTLTDATPSGSWSSSNTAVATVGASTGIVTGVSAGACTITYTVGSSFVTMSFTVNPSPATPTGSSTVTVGGTITLTDITAGGTWVSGNTAIATAGSATGIVTGVAVGTVNIYYSLSTGCSSFKTVTVTSGSVLPITGTFSACVGSTTTLHDSTAGGSWSSSNPSIATIGSSTGIVTGVSAGICTITYTLGTAIAVHSFTVFATPAAIGGPTSVAAGSTITLTDAVSGGTWSSSNTSIATVNATTGVVTGVAGGTVTIYYTIGGTCSVSRTITVTGTSIIYPITGSTHVCIGSSTTLFDSTSGGTWTSSNTAIATVGSSTGVVVGVAAGTCTITYTVGASFVTVTFVVDPIPAAISGSSTVTVGSTITLTDATPGGTWISGNTSRATVTSTGVVTGVSAGTVNIYYTISAGCGVYKTVTVSGTSGVVLPISGTSYACVGSSATLYDSTYGGAWSSSNPSVATVGATTGVVTGVAAGTCTITYAVGTVFATKLFTVYPVPAAITGSSITCIGNSITLSDASTGGVWISGNTTRATVGSTSGVVTGVSAGTVNIYYQFTSTGCGASKTITVTGTPAAIAGSSTACVGSTITLTDATAGGTWTSIYASIATVGSSTGIVTGVTAGVTTIVYSVGGCSVSKSITVNAAPAAISGSSSLCVGASITLTDATTGGTWSSGNTTRATVTSTGGVVTGVSAGAVNIYYTKSGCSVYKSVTVNAVPAAISGSSSVHTSGSPITLTDAVPGGSWFSGNPSIATVGATTGVVTGIAAGSVNIFYSIGGCAVYKTITVLSPAPPTSDGTSTTTYTDWVGLGNNTTTTSDFEAANEVTTGSSATEINTIAVGREITLFPNPTRGTVNIQWENQLTGTATVIVTDIVGREVFKSVFDMNTATGASTIDLVNVKDGMYIISIKSAGLNYSSRLTVQQ